MTMMYSVVQEKFSNNDVGNYNTYGIKLEGDGFSKTIHDVSTIKEEANKMVELFNLHKLSPDHLQEAIEDFISV